MEIIAADHAFCSSNTLHVMDLCRIHFSHMFVYLDAILKTTRLVIAMEGTKPHLGNFHH